MTVIPTNKFNVPADMHLRVLMADSDKDEHLLMSVVASKWFPYFGIDFADDGAQLLLKLAFIESVDDLPSVIVLNRDMAKYDGLRTLCELQAHPVLWQIPVVVVLDTPNVDKEVECFKAGARWVQSKPKTLDDMIDFLDRVGAFAAQPLSYSPCGSLDASVFNQEYAEEIQRSLESMARARRLVTGDLSFPAAA